MRAERWTLASAGLVRITTGSMGVCVGIRVIGFWEITPNDGGSNKWDHGKMKRRLVLH